MECFIAQAAVSQFAKMLIMDYPCALPCYCFSQYNMSWFECGCLVRWGYIIVTVYKARHCNGKNLLLISICAPPVTSLRPTSWALPTLRETLRTELRTGS